MTARFSARRRLLSGSRSRSPSNSSSGNSCNSSLSRGNTCILAMADSTEYTQLNQIDAVHKSSANAAKRPKTRRITQTKKFLCIGVAVAAFIVVALALGLYFGLKHDSADERPLHYGHGAVTANGHECAAIGAAILQRNGSAADAAIATLFCEGVSCPQSMGLGGGVMLTIYTRSTRRVETLMAREWAPLAASRDMFGNSSSVVGAMAIAVPGELLGYWELHQRYGRLPWAELVQPTVKLCRNGHMVTGYLRKILLRRRSQILAEPSMREVFVDPATGDVWNEGDVIRRPRLADTLEVIAREGAATLYKKGGTVLEQLLVDLKEMGSILQEEDFTGYRVRWEEPTVSRVMAGRTMYTSRLPGTGVLVSYIMNVLNGFLPERGLVAYQRISEAFKFAYAKRTDLGDEEFVDGVGELVNTLTDEKFAAETRTHINDSATSNNYKDYGAKYSIQEDHGTAHINILAPNGDAVSVTSTINNIFGAELRSKKTGIIMNDEMDDFSTPGKVNNYGVPASPANFIQPGKRPLSSMCPIIIVDERGDVRLLIGGAGGIKITSSVAFTIVHHWYFNQTLQAAVNERRLHHQLMPMRLDHEKDFSPELLAGLQQRGHQLFQSPTDSGFTSLTAVSVDAEGRITAAVDPRRSGASMSVI